ncbi:MAG: CHC2 zinc finger domain-containing protein [Reyranellaceae bacterium]
MRTDVSARRFDDQGWAQRKNAVLERVSLLAVVERVVRLKRAGLSLQGRCPFHDEKTPSFTVYPRGGTRVRVPFWKCFGCNEGGDVIGFVMRLQGLGFKEAVELLESENGLRHLQPAAPMPPRPAAAPPPNVVDPKVERARRLWAQARPLEPGDPVDLYLRGRCLLPPAGYLSTDEALGPAGWPDSLRYDPQCWHAFERRAYPAMLAAIRGADGALLTVHRTYLAQRPDGGWVKAPIDRARLVVGPFGPGFIPLAPPAASMVGGEGIETSLSAMQLWRRAGLAFVNSGRMGQVEPPFACSDFIYAADKGGKGRWGEKFALAGAKAFGAGRKVAVKIPAIAAEKGDFNDLLVERCRAAGRGA